MALHRENQFGVFITFCTSVKDLSGIIRAGIFPAGPAQPQKFRYKLCFLADPWVFSHLLQFFFFSSLSLFQFFFVFYHTDPLALQSTSK